MKEKICAGLGMLGGMLAAALGGWDTGSPGAAVSDGGGFLHRAGECGSVSPFAENRRRQAGQPALFPGRVPQGGDAGICGRCHAMDLLLESTFLRSAVLIGFCASEVISLTENAGCMGLPLPAAWKNAVSLLNRKSETDSQEKE